MNPEAQLSFLLAVLTTIASTTALCLEGKIYCVEE